MSASATQGGHKETEMKLTKRSRELVWRQGEAYRKKLSIFRNELVGGQVRVTRDEERMLREG